ncbi:MAG: gliding motility-associated ABC transporter substrate-binding protein GldG [Bacteroidetes bacterium]|nr:gliding motility-associated ABC transporter substrate-binding protein GldG [Bacteroidota bacterium]
MWSICKKEWTQYFSSLTGYLIISFYLIVNGLLLFVLPNYNVLDFGYASLQAYFDFAPWFLLLLVPAITMRSFSEEYKQGTYEVLRSMPFTSLQLIIGKWLGCLLIVIAAIIPTFFYAFVLEALSSTGGMDVGATLGSYIGLVFLSAVFTAVGIYASSLTKNSVIALLISIVISIILLKGFDAVSSFPIFSQGNDYYIKQLGLSLHYNNMSKGVINETDLFYFLSILILFVMGSIENIKGKVKSVFMVLALILINYLAHLFPFQLDLTKEKRYTLSNPAVAIVSQIKSPVVVHLYLGGDLPTHYKSMANAAAALLDQLSQLNPTQLKWNLEIPNQLKNDTALYVLYDSLSKLGLPIERVQASGDKMDKRVDQLIIPGALVEVAGQKPYAIDLRSSKKYFKPYNIVKDIPEIDEQASANAAEALLEYKFIQAIYLLNRTTKPSIAYLIGNGEPINLTVNDIGETIKNQYDLSVLDLSKGYPDAQKIRTLLIVKPTVAFSDLDKLKIDQFLMRGGNIIWAVDKLYAEYDSLQKTNGSYIAFDRGLGLDDLFFKYGIRVNANLVQDLNCAKLPLVVGTQADGSPLMRRIPWPYYPFLNGNDQHVLTQNMDRVLSLFPSSIDTIGIKGVRHTILLSTDTSSRSLASPAQVTLNSVKGEADMMQFNQHHLSVAVLSEGTFSSFFENRVTQAQKDSLQQHLGVAFVAKGQGSKQIIISDADIFTNKVDKTNGPMPMGMIPFESYQFANRDFFMNAIQYLNEPGGILESRNKGIVLRVLDKAKVQESRVFWQLLLLLGPLFILAILYFGWNRYRQARFGA